MQLSKTLQNKIIFSYFSNSFLLKLFRPIFNIRYEKLTINVLLYSEYILILFYCTWINRKIVLQSASLLTFMLDKLSITNLYFFLDPEHFRIRMVLLFLDKSWWTLNNYMFFSCLSYFIFLRTFNSGGAPGMSLNRKQEKFRFNGISSIQVGRRVIYFWTNKILSEFPFR